MVEPIRDQEQAIADAKQILAELKPDLIRWTDLLARGQIKTNEFEFLVNSDKELIKMKSLENAGLAATRASAFGLGVLNIAIDTTLRKVVGNTPPSGSPAPPPPRRRGCPAPPGAAARSRGR